MFAAGYVSGFIRVFDAVANKTVLETMIYESPVRDITFSKNVKFMAAILENSRIVIFDVLNNFNPIKVLDYDFPNSNYFSIDFSPDGRFLANISTNANTITVWETDNFTLKFKLDLTGNILSKIRFAPNNKDIVILTATSKLLFYRVGLGEIN